MPKVYNKQLLDEPGWLAEQHHGLKKTIRQISIEFHISPGHIKEKMIEYGIEKRRYHDLANSRRQETCQKKYGKSCIAQLDSVRAKTRETNLKRFGVANPSQSKPAKDRRTKSYRERYGVDHMFQAEEIKEAKRQTYLRKYGVENPSQVKEFQDKKSETWIEKYGTLHPMKNQSVKEKVQSTWNQKYGGHPMQCESVKDKSRKTCLERYGSEFFLNSHISEDARQKIYDPDWLYHQHITQKKTLTQIANELGISRGSMCGIMRRFQLPIQLYQTSSLEREVLDFIKLSVSANVVANTRAIIPPKEIDIYIPEKNLAVEFDGLFWHSFDRPETKAEKLKLLSKTESCLERGVELIHVFENEWLFKQDIVQSIILAKLYVFQTKIYGRECKVVLPTSQETKQFLTENHLQGFCQSKINIGLEYRGELVSLMSFGKPRYDRNHEWELLRFCNKINTSVIGAPGKLLSHFEKTYKPNTLLSYCDRRYSTGKLYHTLGFALHHVTYPNYYYFIKNTNDYQLYPRIKFQKHKLPKLLENFDANLTEGENMFANGYRRIWDCGNLVFHKQY